MEATGRIMKYYALHELLDHEGEVFLFLGLFSSLGEAKNYAKARSFKSQRFGGIYEIYECELDKPQPAVLPQAYRARREVKTK